MGLEVQGNIGSSAVGYDVAVDEKLNVTVAASYTDPNGIEVKTSVKIPAEQIFDKLAAATKNGTVILVEGYLKSAIETYIAAKQAAPASV